MSDWFPLPRLHRGLIALVLIYSAIILAISLLLPLRLAELQQVLAGLNATWTTFFPRVAAIPGSAPVAYLVQLPFALLAHHSRLLLRLPSILAAAANAWLIWRLAKYTPVKSPLAVAIVFLFLPVQFYAACDSRPYELALFFLLLAANQFLFLLESPDVRKVVIYGILLTLAIYTEPASYLPAVGYLLFLLGYNYRPEERRASWFILPATIAPVILYLPYYAWASSHRNPQMLSLRPPFADDSLFVQTLHSLAPETQLPALGATILILLLAGFVAGGLSSFPPFLWPLRTRIHLFTLAGGSILTILLALGFAIGFNAPLIPQHILFAAPGLVILTFSALDWLTKSKPDLRLLTYAAAATLLVILSAPALIEFAITQYPDVSQIARAASENLNQPNTCIVFVSEGDSPYLFELFNPGLRKHECREFFSRRIILLSHPWVRPDQQRDAELFFRGLNFSEKQRIEVSGGLIILDETP